MVLDAISSSPLFSLLLALHGMLLPPTVETDLLSTEQVKYTICPKVLGRLTIPRTETLMPLHSNT